MSGYIKQGKNVDISFNSQYENYKVKQITVQYGINGIRYINIIHSNGIQKMVNHYGEPDSNQKKDSFIFKDMEYLVGDFIITNLVPNFVGYLFFETNLGRKFEVGRVGKIYSDDPDKFKFDVNNSFLAGFYGVHHDNVINQLGIILYKPISKVVLSDVNVIDIKAHSEIKTFERKTYPICNSDKKEIVQKLNIMKREGEKHEIQISTIDGTEISQEFYENLMFYSKLPTLFAKNGNTFEWRQEPNYTPQPVVLDTYSSVNEQIWSDISYCKCTWVEYSWTEGKLSNAPFIGKINYTLTNGFKLDYNVTGFFSKSKVVDYSYKINSKVQLDENICKKEE